MPNPTPAPPRLRLMRTQRDPVPVSVKAGSFSTSVEFTRTLPSGKESAYFVPSVGVVSRRTSLRGETTLDELLDYRIMP